MVVSKARVIVMSVVCEGRQKSAVACDYGISYRWVHTLVGRYLAGGWAAIQPRSRRPKTSPAATPVAVVDQIIALRRALSDAGHDAGAATIAYHLGRTGCAGPVPAASTIWKMLKRHGLIELEPKKRPKSSYIRFQADLPNECWQADFTHWRLADNTGVEILCFLDDHSRLALSVTAHPVVTGTIVTDTFGNVTGVYGLPASTLTDNGRVFTTKVTGGRNQFENELLRRGIEQKNGKPNHPQTQGKVESEVYRVLQTVGPLNLLSGGFYEEESLYPGVSG
ncbi:MAG: transposase [Acidimicrobiales bacterium]|nr:MAG: transposase [Acidimicrobiales bacterium]